MKDLNAILGKAVTANDVPFTRAEEMLFEFEEATDYKPRTLDPIRTFMPIMDKR